MPFSPQLLGRYKFTENAKAKKHLDLIQGKSQKYKKGCQKTECIVQQGNSVINRQCI